MDTAELVTDPFLMSVLATSQSTRDQCIAILDHASSTPTASAVTFSVQQKLLTAYLSQLRGLSRKGVLAVRQTKQNTAEARSEVDVLHLQLQNLQYEQRHLRGEISACESYDHSYQHLPLIPGKDFLFQFPEHKESDESHLMVARINHELAEREALEEERQGLLKQKQSLIADNKKRKDDLANLDQDLEKFIDAAKPIQKLFEKEY